MLKITRLEQQQRHQTELLQKILDTLQVTTDSDPAELPEGITLPAKTVAAMKEFEREIQDEDKYRRMVNISILSWHCEV